MTTTLPNSTATRRRNTAMTAARVFAGVLGVLKLAGMTYFIVIAPEEGVYLGPWIDVPVIATLFTATVLLLVVGFGPGMAPARRIGLGFLAVGLDVAVTLVKIPAYDEPEGVSFLGFSAILLALLLLARRGERAARPQR